MKVQLDLAKLNSHDWYRAVRVIQFSKRLGTYSIVIQHTLATTTSTCTYVG